MVKVKLEDLDKIGNVAVNLEILLYLNELILYDADENILGDKKWRVRKNAAVFLQENLHKELSELKQTLCDYNFTVK